MGGEKGGSKTGGLFNLFDWNRKSRKKLFSNGTVSPEGTKQSKRSDDTLPSTRLHSIEEDVMFGILSPKGSCDYSCASSVTDEEGYGARAPGVVARLMGLDSMPSSSVSDPFSTPFLDSRSLRDSYSQKRSPDQYINDKFNHVPVRAESYFRKPINPKPQKMPSSPIERFQTEVLPPRSAKPLPMTYHKLLSPTKNLAFVSAKNAAEIMEAAAKFIEPGLHTPSNLKDKSSFGTSSIPLKVRDPKEIKGIQQRTSRLLQLSRTADLHDIQFSGGQPLNKSWRSTEDIVIFRPSPEPSYGCNSAETRAKGKSISLAVQAKVNVQRREGLVTSRSNILVQKEREECKISHSFKSQLSIPKNKQQKKPTSGNHSGVLRQNNQKQNCSSNKGKLGSKQSMSNQHGRKSLSGGDVSSMKHMSGSSKVGSRKQVLQTSCLEREGSSSSNKDFPQKKRLTEQGFNTMKSTLIRNVPVSRVDAQVQHNAAIDEHKRWDENDTSDIVSFTFTSPLIKSVNGTPAMNEVKDNWDQGKKYDFDCSHQKVSSAIRRRGPSSGLDVLSGDALSHLLERKLRELTSVMEPSRNFIRGNFATSESYFPVQQDSKTYPDSAQIMPVEHVFSTTPCEDTLSCTSSSDISSINGRMHGATSMLQVPEEAQHSIISDAHMELNQKQLNPLSMLEAEASFTNKSWQSSESSESTGGSNFYPPSDQVENVVSLASSKVASVGIDFQLSDSASSKMMDASASSESIMTHVRDACQMKSKTEDVEYVREILHNRGLADSRCLSTYYLISGKEVSNFLNFESSVYKTSKDAQKLEDKGNKARRRMLFDCVQECLDLKCDLYFRAGYEAWAKGMTLTGTDLAEEFSQEISVWKSMNNWMVDDLVDNDMSINLGKWVSFQVEEFETGKEIQEEILGYLIDEVLADFRVKIKG